MLKLLTSRVTAIFWVIAIIFAANLIQSNSFSIISDDNTAEELVRSQINAAIDVSRDSSLSAPEKRSQIAKIIQSKIDKKWMARFAIGTSWKDLSEEQKNEYVDLYQRYVVNLYSPYLTKLEESNIRIAGVKKVSDIDYRVTVKVKVPSKSEIDIVYRCIITRSGKIKIRDMVLENMSMISTHRAEFKSIIQRNGIEGLLKELKK